MSVRQKTTDTDPLLLSPLLAKRGRLLHVALPDGEFRFPASEIFRLLHPPRQITPDGRTLEECVND